MSADRRFLFLVNPRAGRRARGLARDAGRALGGSVDMALAGEFEEARACLRDADPEVVPVAVGGDGTANLVARALRAEGMAARPMGVIPAGTGNAFAHSIGVGRMARAVTALREGTPRLLDVMVTDHPALPLALVSFSTGFEGRFLAEVSRRRARGLPAFGSPRLLSAMYCHNNGATLTCDGANLLRAEESFYSAGVYNMPCYFFGWRVMREADPADGEGHARVYPGAPAYWSMLMGLGARPRPSVRTRGFRSARLETDGPVQADGEAGEGGVFDILVEAGGLRALGILT